MLVKNWQLAPSVPPAVLRNYRGISPIVAQVLYNRGVTDPQEAFVFLTAEGGTSFDPFKMSDMSKAVGRTRTAILKKQPIAVYGDFDADGATSTALMVQVLWQLGAVVRPYIPHRVDEGYGLNNEALLKLARDGVKLVITVDCGIRSVDEVTYGQQCGLDIIITDHHSLGPVLPPAYAVLNPKRDTPPVESMLAGVGVAFKFCEALVKATIKNERKGSALLDAAQSIDLEGLLDLVAIGTIADLAPMDKLENRLLVRRGLHVLNRAERPGIRALLEAANVNPGSVDSTAIGFSIGPRINAAGRLESAMLAYELLLTRDHARAVALAAQLHELNTRRQELTRDAQEMVRHELALNGQTDLPLIFASHSAFPQGVVGLVAGRLTEEYFRPSVVVQRGADESHGSCRSIPQFDITQALDQCSDLLLRHGGHAQAAGFTILNGNLTLFHERMTEIAAQQLYGQDLRPMLTIDGEADIHHLSEALYEELQQLQPTGHENPPPVLMSTNLHITDWRLVGKDEKHLKLRLTRAGQPPLDAIGFNLGEWAAEMPARIDAAYELDMNEWNGKRTLQLNLKDIRAAR